MRQGARSSVPLYRSGQPLLDVDAGHPIQQLRRDRCVCNDLWGRRSVFEGSKPQGYVALHEPVRFGDDEDIERAVGVLGDIDSLDDRERSAYLRDRYRFLLKKGANREPAVAAELYRYALREDPFNYWATILARRELERG